MIDGVPAIFATGTPSQRQRFAHGRNRHPFYYDHRIRLEGYEIKWMMHAAKMNAPVTPKTDYVAVPAPRPEELQGEIRAKSL